MNFSNRGVQQPQSRPNQMTQAATNTPVSSALASNSKGKRDWLRISSIVLLFSIAVLALGVLLLMHFGNPSSGKYVDSKKLQAVFLSNGQVYFGTIKSVNDKYMDLENIFYLSSSSNNSSSSSSSNNNQLSLIKLGCELHGPMDQMIVSQDQVLFWENLNSNGQVSKAVAQWAQQNPKGQTCSQASSSASQNTSSPQNAGTSSSTSSSSTKQ
ncbi:MAG TPA: hypothetical protein VHT70_00940 [Candidatus Saccharimonadales bacterium]|jgi:hypothetical protein|nr:hypothetical protein [Candidatus Saccharimonadales bacterium]